MGANLLSFPFSFLFIESMIIWLVIKQLSNACDLNFVVDDERISKQRQCHDSVGHWSKQEAYCIFCFSKGIFLQNSI